MIIFYKYIITLTLYIECICQLVQIMHKLEHTIYYIIVLHFQLFHFYLIVLYHIPSDKSSIFLLITGFTALHLKRSTKPKKQVETDLFNLLYAKEKYTRVTA